MSLFFPALSFFLHLKWYFMLETLLTAFFILRYKRKLERIQKQEREKIEECSFYLDELLQSFRKCRKIETALRDILKISEGRLWCIVKKTENKIRLGWQEERCLEKALEIPERYYGFWIMQDIHRFLAKVESEGGECDQVIHFLKDSVKEWKAFELEKKTKLDNLKRRLSLCIVLSGIIWLFLATLAPAGICLADQMLYQLIMLAGINALQVTYVFFLKIGTGVRRKERQYSKADYERMWKKITGPGKKYINSLKKRTLIKEVKRSFPLWMMEMLLRLQTESVASAIEHSIDNCPEVLYCPLRRLNEEMNDNPVSLSPFNNFLKELQLPAVGKMMSGLYAIRSMGEEEAGEQILHLLQQNRQLQNTEKQLRLEEYIGFTGILAAVPMGISVTVMMGNMTLILMQFLQQLSGNLKFPS